MSLRLSGGRKLRSPPGQTARPTTARVRLAVMNLLADDVAGARWLDLCCGSGVMGCEALQRGAAAVLAVDRDRRMAATARANLEAVRQGLNHPTTAEVVSADLPTWLARSAAGPFDLIYLDPPYTSGLHAPITTALAAGQWLAPGGRLIWECSSGAWPELPADWHEEDRRRYGGSGLVLLRR